MKKYMLLIAAVTLFLVAVMIYGLLEIRADVDPEKQAVNYSCSKTEDGKLKISLYNDVNREMYSAVLEDNGTVFEGIFTSDNGYIALFERKWTEEYETGFSLFFFDQTMNLISSSEFADRNLRQSVSSGHADLVVTEQGIWLASFAELNPIENELPFYADVLYLLDPETLSVNDILYHICDDTYRESVKVRLFSSDSVTGLSVTDEINGQTICYYLSVENEKIVVNSTDSFATSEDEKQMELQKKIDSCHLLRKIDISSEDTGVNPENSDENCDKINTSEDGSETEEINFEFLKEEKDEEINTDPEEASEEVNAANELSEFIEPEETEISSLIFDDTEEETTVLEETSGLSDLFEDCKETSMSSEEMSDASEENN